MTRKTLLRTLAALLSYRDVHVMRFSTSYDSYFKDNGKIGRPTRFC